MSEAMTNPEIEDVLASIRRLVAQDRKPRPERLILTEEFRVRQANIPAPPLYPAPPPLTEPPPPARPALAAAVAAAVREAEGAPAVPPVPAELVMVPPAAAVAPPVVEAAPAPPPVTPEPASYAEPFAFAAPAPAPDDLARLEAAIRELEVQIPPAAPAAAACTEPAPAVEPPAPPPESATAPQPAPAPEIVGDDVAFIDEDDLQILVARIVREELRGQLGERITQQVRKLVRAEIARALDERNLLT